MDLQKEKIAHEKHLLSQGVNFKYLPNIQYNELENVYELIEWGEEYSEALNEINSSWCTWQAAKAQAVPEQDQQVWATSNLTWKDIAFRALTCKVLKSTENWVHVKNIACVGSTTASLICKKLGVDPDGTKFELIEAQEPANG
ncbi:hypothetical protein [Acinetobacter towneri]|uniref:hypothetical protein n=1 Tax=Acinetobacter towneri TaxID=202956 RepID=UPI0025785B6E|nr:hypothetical protein [Acinetobacter towneri]